MRPLPDLPRARPSIELPGYREHATESATYSDFAFEELEPGAVCADSFSEFLYRYWIENEIWFRLAEPRPLTDEQRRYAEHYAAS